MTPVILAILLAAADPNAGQAAGGASPTTTVKPAVVAGQKAANGAKDPSKLVCRSEEQQGSRVRNRICLQQEEWDRRDEQLRQMFQDVSDRGGINGGGSTNPMQPH